MKLIFAQGNPGEKYAPTRHNIGFEALEVFAKIHEASFNAKPKYFADIAEYGQGDNKILLVKPTTFYNETGQSARALVDFYKLTPATDVLVIHDDLALPFGTLRTREKGSDAGNNGIKSLNSHIGHEYARLRIGIYNDLRDQIDDATFVLGRFSKEETEALGDIFIKTTEVIDEFITGNHQNTSHSLL